MYLILFIGILLAYEIQKWLMKRRWDRWLMVELRFRDNFVFEGDTSVLWEVVTNDKRLPLPAIEVRIAMNASLVFSGEAAGNSRISDQTSKRDVFSLLMRQQITRSLTFTAKKRGCYHITEADIKGYDFFYQQCGYRTIPQDTAIYVYPAQVDARRIRTICTAISGSVLVQNQVFPDPFEFSGIREYAPTDPASRINWKASIRAQEPMVNQYDSTSNLELALVFDLEDSHIIKEDDLVEETIRIVSSLSAYLVKNHMTVTLYGNAQIPEEELLMEGGRILNKEERCSNEGRTITNQNEELLNESGSIPKKKGKLSNESGNIPNNKELFRQELSFGGGRIEQLNRELACISGASMSSLELLSEIKPASEQLLIFISKNMEPDVTAAVTALSSPSRPVIWVVPVHEGDEQEPPEYGTVQVQFWSVT